MRPRLFVLVGLVALALLPPRAPGYARTLTTYEPADGKTLVLIGQTYTQEFKDYVGGTGRAPAGSSHYGELYTGTINQGDGEAFLSYATTAYPNAYAQVALSWKDNRAASGYPTGDCNLVYKVSKDIVAGRYNSQIDRIAQALKGRPGTKFLLRIEYEVGRFLFSWKNVGGCNTGQPINFSDPAIIDNQAYKDAYNHIARRIRVANGVANVAFVYHPVRGTEDAVALYPGDTYVDWVGVSVFNHDLCESLPATQDNCPATQPADTNLKNTILWAKNTAQKPVIVAEAAVQMNGSATAAGFKTYLNKLFNLVETYDLKGLVYINSNWPAHGWSAPPWGDSRVERLGEVRLYWRQRAGAARYIHASGGTPPTPTPPPAATPTPTGTITVPGVVTQNAETISNGSSRSWTLTVPQAGNYKVLITSASSQNSQLINVALSGGGLDQAIDAGQTISVYFSNVGAGSRTLTITAKSSAVVIGKIEIQRF